MKQQKLKSGNADFTKRLEQSEKLLSRVNGELAQYYKFSRDNTLGHDMGTSYRLVDSSTRCLKLWFNSKINSSLLSMVIITSL